MHMTKVIRLLALFGFLLLIGANGFEMKNLFALFFIPLFFIGKPWYEAVPKNNTK